jgi:excinuclease ABC subunit A
VAQGPPERVEADPSSPTGRCLAGAVELPSSLAQRRPIDGDAVVLRSVSARNLAIDDVRFPLGTLIAVTGVSGSGKSTLVRDVLRRALSRAITNAGPAPGSFRGLEGAKLVARVAEVDQRPIGRTPRSVPATYTDIMGPLRELFAGTAEARARGFGAARFSFNAKEGRCAECMGQGILTVAMAFLPDVVVPCDACGGARYDRSTLEVRFGGRSIGEVLALTVAEAREAFAPIPRIRRPLDLLFDLGLGYLALGQPSTHLSGGEAQRVKLAKELSKNARGRSFYVLDEPTTGLHLADATRLTAALQRLVDRGDTVVVIEHHLEVIAAADLVIDLGPEGGARGGRVVAVGRPDELAKRPPRESHTARALRALFAGKTRETALAR